MPHYFVVDARFSINTDPNYPPNNIYAHKRQAPLPSATSSRGMKSRRGARSGSMSISSLSAFPTSPVNRFAQSMGPERTKPAHEDVFIRHTTPAMSTRRCDVYFADSWDSPLTAKSNRRSVWRRIAENVDKCVIRVVSKFYK
jgi:hypothetical protein